MNLRASAPGTWRNSWVMILAWGMVVVLFYFTLRDIPLDQIWRSLRLIGWTQIVLLVSMNVVILLLMTLRWWIILHSLKHANVPLPVLFAYRLTGFGVSFFTPGPQFGGEPVQVSMLYQREKVPLPTAISSVYLDRTLDLLANFTFLALGVMVVIVSGFSGESGMSWAWIGIAGVLLMPMAHLAALFTGRLPVTFLLTQIVKRRQGKRWQRVHALVAQSEASISQLCQERPFVLVGMILLSGAIWLFMIFEYGLTLYFLGVAPTLVETIIAMTAGRFALLAPLPGGLGVLEASQVFITRELGWGSQVGIALSLIIRARDLSLALIGVGWGILVFQSHLKK